MSTVEKVEPVPLSTPDGQVGAYACGVCGRIYVGAVAGVAGRCCVCEYCGAVEKNRLSPCSTCSNERQRKRTEAALEKAKMIPEAENRRRSCSRRSPVVSGWTAITSLSRSAKTTTTRPRRIFAAFNEANADNPGAVTWWEDRTRKLEVRR